MGPSETTTRNKTADVILLTGFLGAGKTTLLKNILSWSEDLSGTIVMVNEFGEVGIDGDLLKGSGSEVVELTSGCICCTLSNDMLQSLSALTDKYRPDRIIIEASGVADPTAVIAVLGEPALRDRLALDKVVTVLDADFWEAREHFGPLFYNQLEMAHLILLNKVDLLDRELIPRFLEEIHDTFPRCRVVPTIRCGVDPETIWSVAGKPAVFGLKPMSFYQPADAAGAQPGARDAAEPPRPVDASQFVTFSYRTEKEMDEEAFAAFVAALPFEVFRMKGPVRLADRTALVNHVGGQTEWGPWDGARETKLAFIGWKIDGREVIARLDGCRRT